MPLRLLSPYCVVRAALVVDRSVSNGDDRQLSALIGGVFVDSATLFVVWCNRVGRTGLRARDANARRAAHGRWTLLENDSCAGEHRNVIAAERRRRILDRARRFGSVNVSELADLLGVGVTTIRQDLRILDREGKVTRSHGGAVLRETATARLPYSQTRGERIREKSAIALAALRLLPASGCFLIGPGTTTYEFARRLPDDRGFHVVTNSLEVAVYLVANGKAEVDFLGGSIRHDSLASDVSLPESELDEIFWEAAFVGAAAIDIARGITTVDRRDAELERKIIRHSSKVVVLCDSSKFGKFSFARVGPVSVVDIIVTDAEIAPHTVDRLTEEGIEVVVADTRAE